MPRYFGEGPHEMYWERDGKWYHALGNGHAFDTHEAAERDYQIKRPRGFVDTVPGAILSFIGFILLALLCK